MDNRKKTNTQVKIKNKKQFQKGQKGQKGKAKKVI